MQVQFSRAFGGFGFLCPDLRDLPVRLDEFRQFLPVLGRGRLLRFPVHQGRHLHVLTRGKFHRSICIK
jgi:hypothetical protein